MLRLDGAQHLALNDLGAGASEAEDLSFRFKTRKPDALLVATRDDSLMDKLEISLNGGRLKASLHIGLIAKTVSTGSGLDDNLWHTVKFQRRGMSIELRVDRRDPLKGNRHARLSEIHYSRNLSFSRNIRRHGKLFGRLQALRRCHHSSASDQANRTQL